MGIKVHIPSIVVRDGSTTPSRTGAVIILVFPEVRTLGVGG